MKIQFDSQVLALGCGLVVSLDELLKVVKPVGGFPPTLARGEEAGLHFPHPGLKVRIMSKLCVGLL